MIARGRRLGRRSYALDAQTLAQRLLGCTLVRISDDSERLAGVIVETEAYIGVEDLASHARGGRRTARNEAMYAQAGTAYVYFTYGMHDCFNVVCGKIDEPVAVLVRALEPVDGLETMRRHRGGDRRDTDLCSGPAKLCQAMRINRTLNGVDLVTSDALWIEGSRSTSSERVIARGARIGVGYAGEWAKRPFRWWVKGNPHVSR